MLLWGRSRGVGFARAVLLAGLLMGMLLPLGSCSSGNDVADSATTTTVAEPKVTVAWINQGAASEDPWTRSHREAADQVARGFGAEVEVQFVENVALGPETDKAIDLAVRKGADMVIGTSLAQSTAIAAGARRHPAIKFEQARADEVASNLANFTGAYEETAYLVGMAAGAASQSGKLAFVAQYEQPEYVRIVNAYTLGAQSQNPAAKVLVGFTNSWFDPDGETAMAQRLIDQGADVLSSTCTSTATGELAQRLGIPWSGHDENLANRFADVWLTASLTSWGPHYERRVEELLAGQWKSEEYYGNLADGFIRLAPIGDRVSSTSRRAIQARRAEIADGQFDVFAGPLTDQAGTVRVNKSETVSRDERRSMNWYVIGVTIAGS